MKTTHIKFFAVVLMSLFMSVRTTALAEDVTPSVTLTSYYSAANGKTSDALRTALQGIIDNHTVVAYSSLGTLMQYSDTEEANGTDVIDIYSTCTFTVSGALSWGSTGSVGAAMNREHTVPQSWFNEAAPMVSDAFHIYPTDCKANNNRSSYLYGEFSATGTSYSSSSCAETGKLSDSGKQTIASYSYNNTTYSPSATYTGKVYEPADEFKGDIARGYFYMATRYADVCSSWSGGAFGSDNNGLKNYTAELMLKWHRQDPVSRKELIRNEVIYGNAKYNKSNKKQGNRNPFIDYPELVEYIWGDKKSENVNISSLVSGYAEAATVTPVTTYNVTLWRNGSTQVISEQTGTYSLPAKETEADACADWVFDGWSTGKVTETTTQPSYVTSVSSASTLYAVYAKTESAGSAPSRTKMAESTATYTFTSKSWAATEGNWTSGKDGNGYSNSGVQVTTGTTEANATCPTSYSNISSIVVSYCTNASKGAGTIVMSVGENEVSQSVSTSGGTTARDLTFDFSSTKPTGTPKITVNCTTNSIYVCGVTINYGTSGGSTSTTYYDSEPEDCNCTGQLGTPAVTATPSDGTITLMWADVSGATNGYSVTIDKGVGYTTECSDVEIGEVTHSGSTNTCVITGLVNGLSYTTSVVANGTTSTCESDADEDTTTPVGCEAWADPTFTYPTYNLLIGGASVSPTISGTTYGTPTFSSSNTSVLTVNSSGVVTPAGVGTAVVTVMWPGDATHCAKEMVSATFTVAANSHNVAFTPNPANATVTVNGQPTSPQRAEYGSTVTIAVTPAAHYSLSAISVSGAGGNVTLNGSGNMRMFTMPDEDVTVTVTVAEDPKYTINFYVEGALVGSQNVYAGSTPDVPSDPTPCDGGYSFEGWWTNTLDADNTTAQTWITDFTVSQAQDYYAVFSYSEGGASSVSDELTRETTGVTGTNYMEWSGKSSNSDAIYAGQSAGGNSSIQMRSSNNNSGVITTASGGKLTKVEIVWNSNTSSGRTINVYGKNTAYSAATNLYDDSNQGTLLGTIVYGTSTELTVDGDYEYVGIRSASGALYIDKLTITWGAAGAGATYYTTSTCTAAEPMMMVSELDGAYFAVTHDFSESAIAAMELIGLNETYYYKPGATPADVTWYVERGRTSGYLSNSAGQYLAADGETVTMRAERFAWSMNDAGQFVTEDNTGLCYDSKNKVFVLADLNSDNNNWHLSAPAAQQSLGDLYQASTYTRSGIVDGQYATICLPYAISQTFLETADVYNVTGKFVSGSRVTGVALTPEEGILEAGKPYVIQAQSSGLNAYYGEITATEVVQSTGLVGNIGEEPIVVPAGCYGLSDNRLRLVAEGGIATTGQYKAYFDLRDVPEVSATDLPMGSKMMYTTDADDTLTGMEVLSGTASDINWQLPVYNVLGIRVGEDATGVLIQNGIKYLKY